MTPVRLPEWVQKRAAHHESLHVLKSGLRVRGLHTVCESARCPNIHECFHRGTATFLILGNLCTRGCGFCSVPKGAGGGQLPPDPDEPTEVASMAAKLGLRYVVITSVTRDDLGDGGAAHFARTVRAVRAALPEARIEILTPDFQGDRAAIREVLDSSPDVFNHNIETVPRMYPRVRPQAGYARSLEVLRFAREYRPEAIVKSGLMVGLGESGAEVEQTLADLRQAGVDAVTIGQYLRPTRHNLPVAEYVTPAQFDAYRAAGERLGFKMVFSGPLVRSSYMADDVFTRACQP
ncbi:MAG: lipoyl synthase [Acidobacteriales bacterium]|nr:lipoyl synthase [Terriglobales bacterium]